MPKMKRNIERMIESMTLEKVAPESLVGWDQNPRVHGDVDLLLKSIDGFGWTAPILAQRGTGRVVAGHRRLLAALRKRLKVVPVIFLDLSDEEASGYTIADNSTTEQSEWEFSKLRVLLDELKTDGFDLDMTGLSSMTLGTLIPDDDRLAGKAYDESVADGVALAVRFKIDVPVDQDVKFEAALKALLKKFPDVEYTKSL